MEKAYEDFLFLAEQFRLKDQPILYKGCLKASNKRTKTGFAYTRSRRRNRIES
jgi:hypothetical protein